MNYETQICELYFLLHKGNVFIIGSRLSTLLMSLKYDYKNNIYKDSCISHLKTLYLLIGHVRDIYFGHGQRDLSYIMIYTWYKYFPVLAIFAFHRFVQFDCNDSPFGCWNDIKYFCKFIAKVSDKGCDDPLIDVAVSCANKQLVYDYLHIHHDGKGELSNLSKWIPRENKIDWLYEKLVLEWFSHTSYSMDLSFMKKKYRQMISNNCRVFNRNCSSINVCPIDDVCPINDVYSIDDNKNDETHLFPSILADTTNKNIFKKVIEFQKIEGPRFPIPISTYSNPICKCKRICKKDECSTTLGCRPKYINYFYDNVFIGIYIKTAISIVSSAANANVNANVNMNVAVNTICSCDSSEIDITEYCNNNNDAIWLNKNWSRLVSAFSKCHGGIPFIDLKLSLDDLYNAIGFACLISIKSGIYRILLISNMPIWIDVSDCSDNICLMVNKIWSFCEFVTSSKYSYSFDIINEAIMKHSNELKNIPVKFFIFSDNFSFYWSDFLKGFSSQTAVIFWNLGSGDILLKSNDILSKSNDILSKSNDILSKSNDILSQSLIESNNIIYMSGSCASLLRDFCADDFNFNFINSHSFISNLLKSPRYHSLANYFDTFVLSL